MVFHEVIIKGTSHSATPTRMYGMALSQRRVGTAGGDLPPRVLPTMFV